MTNPDNIVRVRARNGGRASVYEANGWCQAYGAGILEGTGVTQNTSADMHVLVGGSSSKPDVIIAQNPAGYKIALDIVGQQAVTITTPASNSRISAIVVYTDDLSLESTEDTVTGSPASCGLIVVNGTASATPSAPTDTQIRNAITSDGATGSQASYAVIATVLVASNTTTITNSLITRNQATMGSAKLNFPIYNVGFDNNNIGTTEATLSSYTITVPGNYLVFAFADFNLSGHDVGDAYFRINKNTSVLASTYFNNPQNTYFFGGLTLFAYNQFSAGDMVKVVAKTAKSTMGVASSNGRSKLLVVYIGQ